jgi:hypothetical protein
MQLISTPVPVKMIFILVSVAIIVFIILRNLIITTRLILGEWGCRKPSINYNPGYHKELRHYNFDRFSDILLTFIGFLHIPEHIYPMVYLYKFIGVYINWKKSYRDDIWSEMKKFTCSKKKAPRVILNGIVLILMLSVALILPSMM